MMKYGTQSKQMALISCQFKCYLFVFMGHNIVCSAHFMVLRGYFRVNTAFFMYKEAANLDNQEAQAQLYYASYKVRNYRLNGARNSIGFLLMLMFLNLSSSFRVINQQWIPVKMASQIFGTRITRWSVRSYCISGQIYPKLIYVRKASNISKHMWN